VTSILDETAPAPAKMLVIGDNGSGKTGALASLVCMGYKLRIIDTDKGVATLRSLLVDRRYPYAAYCEAHGINLREAVSFKSIDVDFELKTLGKERILAPKNAKAWDEIISALEDWTDTNGPLRNKKDEPTYGHFTTWDKDTVVVTDSFTTTAKFVYYHMQAINGRLGAREEGYDYQRDTGSAQKQLERYLEMMSAGYVQCNVIIISHVTRIDDTGGVVQSPEQRARDGRQVNAKGYPSSIGRALSRNMGKFFNDIYVVEATGSGTSVKRQINTVPVDNVNAKTSAYLERSYDITTGMAEIFAALSRQPAPTELIEHCKKFGARSAPVVVRAAS
jgi:hypothetical protein